MAPKGLPRSPKPTAHPLRSSTNSTSRRRESGLLCCSVQVAPPSDVSRITPPARPPTAHPVIVSTNSTLISHSVVPLASAFHVSPPLSVFSRVPFAPTAQPELGSTKSTPNSVSEVPLSCRVHVIPPSVVLSMVPRSPTAKPVVASTKLTSHRTGVEPRRWLHWPLGSVILSGWTLVSSGATLLLISGSVSLALTSATLLMKPASRGITSIWTVADSPWARLPRLQKTVPFGVAQTPSEAVNDTKVTLSGRASSMLTPVAVPGPRLVTTTV